MATDEISRAVQMTKSLSDVKHKAVKAAGTTWFVMFSLFIFITLATFVGLYAHLRTRIKARTRPFTVCGMDMAMDKESMCGTKKSGSCHTKLAGRACSDCMPGEAWVDNPSFMSLVIDGVNKCKARDGCSHIEASKDGTVKLIDAGDRCKLGVSKDSVIVSLRGEELNVTEDVKLPADKFVASGTSTGCVRTRGDRTYVNTSDCVTACYDEDSKCSGVEVHEDGTCIRAFQQHLRSRLRVRSSYYATLASAAEAEAGEEGDPEFNTGANYKYEGTGCLKDTGVITSDESGYAACITACSGDANCIGIDISRDGKSCRTHSDCTPDLGSGTVYYSKKT